jgi:hypothetical protein
VALRSPVDTGRFRANWNVSVNAPNESTNGATDGGAGRVNKKTFDAAADFFGGPSPVRGRALSEARKALTLPVGGVTYMTNGLPYAQRLEFDAWSDQAPAGMVRISAQEFGQYVRKAVASV